MGLGVNFPYQTNYLTKLQIFREIGNRKAQIFWEFLGEDAALSFKVQSWG